MTEVLINGKTGECGEDAFQGRVHDWMLACFGADIAADQTERCHRFLEEVIELVQALGATRSEAHQLVDYVFGREIGEPSQEVGGVMVTLAALCTAVGLDMPSAGEIELARAWTKIEKIRAKQAAKPKHSPLPESPHPDAVAKAVEAEREACVKIVEDIGIPYGPWQKPEAENTFDAGVATARNGIAAAIRARTTSPSPPFDEAAERKAFETERDAARYRWLRERDLETVYSGGVFIGETPRNMVLNLEHADAAIDEAMADERGEARR